jgi:hypothetical protein
MECQKGLPAHLICLRTRRNHEKLNDNVLVIFYYIRSHEIVGRRKKKKLNNIIYAPDD